jgi:hypothetical protein
LTRNVCRRLERLETHARHVAALHPVHRFVFADDPEPTDLPPGSTVHRIVFVDLAARPPLNEIPEYSEEELDRFVERFPITRGPG